MAEITSGFGSSYRFRPHFIPKEKARICPQCGKRLGEMEVRRGESQYAVFICGRCGWLKRQRI